MSTVRKFQFVGGDLALDFCNTVGGKRGVAIREHLESCSDYLAWCEQAGLLDAGTAQACALHSAQFPGAAAATLQRAVALREAIFRIFAAVIAKMPPQSEDIDLLNSELSQSLCRLRVVPGENQDGFAWQWGTGNGTLEGPLGPIADAAATLLTNDCALQRLRMCNGDNCGWLFADSSKNHTRRWCDMGDCGNRAKVRRHRLKQKHGRDHDNSCPG